MRNQGRDPAFGSCHATLHASPRMRSAISSEAPEENQCCGFHGKDNVRERHSIPTPFTNLLMVLKHPYESKWEKAIESLLCQVSSDFIESRFPDELRDQRAARPLFGKSV